MFQKIINAYQAYQTNQQVNRFLKIMEQSKRWEVGYKEKLVEDGKLDPRLDVLINVQSKLFVNAKTASENSDAKTLSWKDVNEVVNQEIRKVITDQYFADRQRNQPPERRNFQPKDA